jgi:hypothetical protein
LLKSFFKDRPGETSGGFFFAGVFDTLRQDLLIKLVFLQAKHSDTGNICAGWRNAQTPAIFMSGVK